MSQPVVVDFRKYPNTAHWRYEMYRFARDEDGVWLWAPPGTTYARGDEPPKTSENIFITLVPQDAWWLAIWNVSGKYEVYVDVCTPPRWDGDTVHMIDLDLDVVRMQASGETRILDEDEFESHSVDLGYPQRLVDGARTATAALVLALEARTGPFGDIGIARLNEAIRVNETRSGI